MRCMTGRRRFLDAAELFFVLVEMILEDVGDPLHARGGYDDPRDQTDTVGRVDQPSRMNSSALYAAIMLLYLPLRMSSPAFI